MSQPKPIRRADAFEMLYVVRHKQMLEYQKQIAPFTPTIRDLMEIWGLKSTSIVKETLSKMAKRGLVIRRERGAKHAYYAVEAAHE